MDIGVYRPWISCLLCQKLKTRVEPCIFVCPFEMGFYAPRKVMSLVGVPSGAYFVKLEDIMKIIEKMASKAADLYSCEGVTIAFLGDSVTQGCFEIYKLPNNGIETVFDKKNSYEMKLFDILATLYPNVPVNIINAGISGDNAPHGCERVARDVLRHQPDLTVVCYGLNDCGGGLGGISTYADALKGIFEQVLASGSELIFMTPNMMNTKVSPHLTEPVLVECAQAIARRQNDNVLDAYLNAAKAVCADMNVTVCDCYAIWKRMYECGVDTTELLANKINHPTREMNGMFAYELAKTMFFN
jgi:lysophospholipase L1-like esterase